MQNDLISRSALIEHMCRSCTSKCNLDDECCCSVDAVENAPAVDAVEVVRCKDCKHKRHLQGATDEANVCGLGWGLSGIVAEEDFCSSGKRRDEHSWKR